ncbi:MAG: ABC transporter permease subunit [Armatimonadota bacterium]|nr:ABC transporter permease [Armatimonadota bacterium]MCX7777139.1 ABC transporter permease [Armatimonadota bacterium]MDW8025186.1 ABC transporter permease subunit [Armatimonadota bacterium]
MRVVWVIARNTFHEAIRRKFFWVIFLFALVAIASANLFSGIAPGEEKKFVFDFGLGSITLFGMLIVVFLGATMIPSEVDRRTIFTILSKPVRRWQFLIGKFLGLALTTLVTVACMGALLIAVHSYIAKGLDINVVKAVVLAFFQLLIVGAIALAASTRGSLAFNIVFAVLVYFVGAQSSSLLTLAEPEKHLAHAHTQHVEPVSWKAYVFRGVLKTIYWLVPHLDNFDVRQAIVTDSVVPWQTIFNCILYGLLYCSVLVIVAIVLFQDQEF